MPSSNSHQYNHPLLVSALIVNRQNSLGEAEFLNVRADDKTKCGFPGGKIETDETPQQAVVRETIEELLGPVTDSSLASYDEAKARFPINKKWQSWVQSRGRTQT